MFALSDKVLVIFDLEYTDPGMCDVAKTIPEITEIGAIKITSALEPIETFQRLVRPQRLDLYSEFCEKLTGIKKEQLEQAKYWKDIWREFAEFTEYNGTRLLAWHAYNDYKILEAAYLRNELGFPHERFVVDVASMCYFLFSYLGIRTTWSLEAVCNRLHEKKMVQIHRALSDCYAVLSVLQKLCRFETEFFGSTVNGNSRQHSDVCSRNEP